MIIIIMLVIVTTVLPVVVYAISDFFSTSVIIPQFKDGEIIWVGGWLFFLQMISQDWEGVRTSNLA